MTKRHSLKVKLAFFATLLVIFVATSLSTYIRSGQKKAVVESQQTGREDSVRALRQVAREALLVDDDTNMVNYVNLLKKSYTVEYAMVLNSNGKVNVHTDPLLIGKVLDDASSKAAMDQRERQMPFVQEVRSADGKNILDISLPIIIGASPGEFKGVARIGFDEEAIDKASFVSI
jgi:sensor histidine kinase regulating citrate/malate metabolism